MYMRALRPLLMRVVPACVGFDVVDVMLKDYEVLSLTPGNALVLILQARSHALSAPCALNGACCALLLAAPGRAAIAADTSPVLGASTCPLAVLCRDSVRFA